MKQEAGLSRRGFVKAAGAATVALAASSLAAGCAPKDPKQSSQIAGEGSSTEWTDEADVVIMGLGAAGVAAAVEAVAAQSKVIAIEKAEKAGGATVLSGGLIYMGGGTKLQTNLGIEDTPENFKNYLSKALGKSSDPELFATFCDQSVDLYDWCVEQGMKFEGGVDETSHVVEPPEGISLIYSGNERTREYMSVAAPAPRGHAPKGGAINIIEPLLSNVEGDMDIRYKTTGTELVVDSAGAVIGIKAKGPDKGDLAIKANKGVILTSGAFTFNEGLVADARAEVLSCKKRTGGENDLGDGLLAALKIGAATHSLSRMTIGEHVYLYGALSSGALLDYRGHRILSEDWYGSFIGRKVLENSPDSCFIILDQPLYDEVMQNPSAKGLPEPLKADTLEDIAKQTGLPEGNVVFSIERYNEFCDQGVDSDFDKGVEYLQPLVTPPFYAVPANLGALASYFTLGGLKINPSAQVVDLDGAAIPGLYAAGRCSCGIFGEYAGSGSSIADGLTFGRIAGKAAATSA